MDKTSIGSRMKTYESVETSRKLIPGIPIIARIDGRSFSKLTKKMDRPYDPFFMSLMQKTMKYLISETNAIIGYTQSDEISLLWHQEDPNSQMLFGGKVFKLVSTLAAMATAKFNTEFNFTFPEYEQLPTFDCRVFQVPSKSEAANYFVWREQDCTKNAVSMAARSFFSHKSLHGLSGNQMQEKMWQEANTNFNDYPPTFKRGTWARRFTAQEYLTDSELMRIPQDKRPKDGCVTRTRVHAYTLPQLSKMDNKIGVIYDNEEPTLK